MVKKFLLFVFLLLHLTCTPVNADWADAWNSAKEAALSTAEEYIDASKVNTDLNNTWNSAKKTTLATAGEYTDAITNKGLEKSKSVLNEIYFALVELNKAGFRADEIWVKSALIPIIVIIFEDVGETGKENEIIKNNKGKTILLSTLDVLLSTRKFRVAHYGLRRIKIEFTVPPTVTLQMTIDDL